VFGAQRITLGSPGSGSLLLLRFSFLLSVPSEKSCHLNYQSTCCLLHSHHDTYFLSLFLIFGRFIGLSLAMTLYNANTVANDN